MTSQESSYAQVRIGFYEARFQSETISQLVTDFNTLSASRGWTAERSYFSTALTRELQRRGVNLSSVCQYAPDGTIASVRHLPVQYDEEHHALIPIQ